MRYLLLLLSVAAFGQSPRFWEVREVPVVEGSSQPEILPILFLSIKPVEPARLDYRLDIKFTDGKADSVYINLRKCDRAVVNGWYTQEIALAGGRQLVGLGAVARAEVVELPEGTRTVVRGGK